MTFDELRAAHPELGLAVYAYEPGGVVTLEIHDGGHVYPFGGTTLREAIEKAFPPAPPSERDIAAARLDEMAGVDANGGIIPPDDIGIDHSAFSFWRNTSARSVFD